MTINHLLSATILTASLAISPVASAQKPMTFDVATIKPSPADGRPAQGWIRPDGIEFASQTLPQMLCTVYGYSISFDGQVTGVPAWAEKQLYDISAKISAEDAAAFQKLSNDDKKAQMYAMMQSLLAERFHLTLHKSSKDLPVYELVVAKGGVKMKDSATDPDPSLKRGDDGKPVTSLRWVEKTTVLQATSTSWIANILSIPAASVGRPVIDKTGLTGTYDFTFNWSIYYARAAAAPPDSPDAGSVPSVFTALGELGLKLQPATASFETLVIDHAEPPTKN